MGNNCVLVVAEVTYRMIYSDNSMNIFRNSNKEFMH